MRFMSVSEGSSPSLSITQIHLQRWCVPENTYNLG